jgi:hypothetical protein
MEKPIKGILPVHREVKMGIPAYNRALAEPEVVQLLHQQ